MNGNNFFASFPTQSQYIHYPEVPKPNNRKHDSNSLFNFTNNDMRPSAPQLSPELPLHNTHNNYN